MKKALLISAFALGSLVAANAQATLTQTWINHDVAGLSGSTRQAVGHDGKFYLLNSGFNGAEAGLEIWGSEGLEAKVNPEDGLLRGTNITIDDAGNIIGRAGEFPNAFAGNTGMFVYQSETATLHTFDLDGSVLIGGRNDFWGHVSGDVMSEEGGLLLFSTNTNGSKFNEIKIANGQHVVGGQQGLKNDYWWWAGAEGEEAVGSLYGTCGIISTYNWMPDEAALNVGADGNSKRQIHHMIYDKTGDVWVWKQDGKYCIPDRNVTTGFAFFKMGEETYIVYSRGGNNADAIVIVKARIERDGETIEDPSSLIVYQGFAATDESWNTIYNGTANTAVHFNVEVAEDGTSATIYQYVPKHFIAAYEFKADSTTGVSEIQASENAPVEYYNIQGVKVQNPENGLYIMRQGNKATKVVR